MTTRRGSPPWPVILAGMLPVGLLAFGWLALGAIGLWSNINVALAVVVLLAVASAVLGAALHRRTRSRLPIAVSCALLFAWVAVATWAGSSWLICGEPAALSRRLALSLVAGGIPAGGYWIATANLSGATSRGGVGPRVDGLLVASGIAFLTVVALLGLFVMFIDPGLTCMPIQAR